MVTCFHVDAENRDDPDDGEARHDIDVGGSGCHVDDNDYHVGRCPDPTAYRARSGGYADWDRDPSGGDDHCRGDSDADDEGDFEEGSGGIPNGPEAFPIIRSGGSSGGSVRRVGPAGRSGGSVRWVGRVLRWVGRVLRWVRRVGPAGRSGGSVRRARWVRWSGGPTFSPPGGDPWTTHSGGT